MDMINPLDELLSTAEVYHLPPSEVEAVRAREIGRAVAYHAEHNDGYGAYCERAGFSPGDVAEVGQLDGVPLLPSALFKTAAKELLTTGPAPGGSVGGGAILETTSSGTKGAVSLVPRDDVTLMRFFASISAGVRDVGGVEDFAMRLHNLGPSPQEAAHLWISYVMAGAAVFFESQNYVRDGVFEVGELALELRGTSDPVLVVGPPALLMGLCVELGDSKALSLQPDSLVVAVGGWKRADDKMIEPAGFRAQMASSLGLGKHRVRDAFNMVELNSVLFECSEHAKHVPPWLYASARHPRSLAAQPGGEPGVLAYLDPTALSYPCFVLSDDFGWVEREVACPCGLLTDTLVIERRINRIDSRGCALKMNYSRSDRRA